MSNKSFAKFGNLAFYDEASYKYIYFGSLLSQSGDPEYVTEANRIAQEGAGLYSSLDDSNNILESRIEDYRGKWEKILVFLQQAIAYEQQNEIKYFSQQLDNFKKTFKQEDIEKLKGLSQLQDILEDAKSGTINYPNLLALINTVMLGFNNAKATAEYEKKRITEIETAFEELRKKRANQLAGLAYKRGMNIDETIDMIDRSLDTFDKETADYYIKHKNFKDSHNSEGKKVDYLRGAQEALKNVKGTVDVEMAKWINKEVETIFKSKSMMNHIIEYCHTNGIISSQNYDKLGTEVLSFITQSIMQYAKDHLYELIKDEYKSIDKDKLFSFITSNENKTQTYQIEGLFKGNFGVYRNRVNAYDDVNKELQMEERSSEGMLGAFARLRNAVKHATSKHIKLNRDQQALYKFMKDDGFYSDFDKFESLLYNLEKYQNWIEASEKRIQRNPKLKEQVEASVKKNSLGKNANGESVFFEIEIDKDGHINITNLEQLKTLKSFQNIFGENSTITLSTLKNSIRNLRYQGGRALRNRYAQAIDKAVSTLTGTQRDKEYKRLDTIIRKGLENIHVSVTGPTVSEVLSAIEQSPGQLADNWAGKGMAKNDVITITIDTNSMHLETAINELANQRELTFAQLLEKNLSTDDINTQLEADLIMAFQTATSKAFADLGNKQHRYREGQKLFLNRYKNLQESKKKLDDEEKHILDEWQNFKKSLEQQGATPDEIKQKYNEFLNSIKDSIYVSTTVKTYNHYKNNLGFGGGSIGANLTDQLNNISDMFEMAGVPITPLDQEWLYGAIINSSTKTILGESVKHSIENYLGSIAAFMLFDEGGAEATMIADIQSQASKGLAESNPSILHLYRVNGIYVCGSYVLQEVYNQLNNCWQAASMALEPNYKGAGIRIVNPMSEKDIPNRGKEKMSQRLNKDPWGTVGRSADKKVSLEIFFLAGLLDIATGLEEAMNSIELPG